MHFVCKLPPPPRPSHTLEQPPWGIYHHISFYKLCVQTPSIQGRLSVTIHTHSRAALFGGLPPHQFLYELTASCTAYCQFLYILCTNSRHPVQPLVSFYTLCVQTHSILYRLSVSIHFVYKLTASCTAYQLPHTHSQAGGGGEGSTTTPVSIHFVYKEHQTSSTATQL